MDGSLMALDMGRCCVETTIRKLETLRSDDVCCVVLVFHCGLVILQVVLLKKLIGWLLFEGHCIVQGEWLSVLRRII